MSKLVGYKLQNKNTGLYMCQGMYSSDENGHVWTTLAGIKSRISQLDRSRWPIKIADWNVLEVYHRIGDVVTLESLYED